MRRTMEYIVLCGMLSCMICTAAGCARTEEAVFAPAETEQEQESERTDAGFGSAADMSEGDAAGLAGANLSEGKVAGLTDANLSEGDASGLAEAGRGREAGNRSGSGEPQDPGSSAAGGPETPDPVYVDVCGQVRAPGVYEMPAGSRVFEAIECAGGMTEKAAGEAINKAAFLEDGQQIYVPSRRELQKQGQAGVKPAGAGGSGQGAGGNAQGTGGSAQGAGGSPAAKVNLNTAAKEELMTLSGIGEVKADAILRYREEHGAFRSIEEIKKIGGIKDGVFEQVKEQITV